MKAVEVKGFSKSFSKGFIPRKHQVLKDVNFAVPSGSITGFLGANGAGKTTTLKCMLGLNRLDEGEFIFFEKFNYASIEVKKRIGFLPERPYFYEYLTGEEFLSFYGQMSDTMTSKELKLRISELLERVKLEYARKIALRNYSKGMLQKIGLAQALIHKPDLVILDEPMAGLDPDGRGYLKELILQTAEEGAAVFFSSHLLGDAERLCKNLVILKLGEIVYEGSTDSLLESMGYTTKIAYKKADQICEISVKTLEGVQQKIDAIRKDGHMVIEVKKDRMGLEEAFVKLAL